MANNLTGKTISNRYVVEEMLGQGGMSAVYKGTDPNLKRVVAIKVIHSHLSNNPDFVQRFEEEAAALCWPVWLVSGLVNSAIHSFLPK